MTDPSFGANLSELTVVLSFFQGAVGNRRRIPATEVKTAQEARETGDAIVQTEVDKDALYVSKRLFDSAELKAVLKHNSKVRAEIRGRAIPSKVYRAGMYLYKATKEATLATDEYLAEQQVIKNQLVEAFIVVMPAEQEKAKVSLGPAYEEADFPTPAQVRKAFLWSWSWLSQVTPAKLKQISAALFEREAQKAQESLESMVRNVEVLLAQEARKFVDNLVDRLTPGEDGKRKVFRNTLTTNISDFVKQYPLRNLGSSEQLDEVMSKMGALLDGVDPEQLRENDRLAQDLREGFLKVQAELTTIEQPDRILELE